MELSCGSCGKDALSKCSRCKVIYYCSRQCQSSHWKEHQKKCVLLTPPKRIDVFLGRTDSTIGYKTNSFCVVYTYESEIKYSDHLYEPNNCQYEILFEVDSESARKLGVEWNQVGFVPSPHKEKILEAWKVDKANQPNFLIVGGAMFYLDADFWLHGSSGEDKGFIKMLNEKKYDYEIIELKKKLLVNKLATKKFTCCIIMNIGSGGDDKFFDVEDVTLKHALTTFVEHGNCLLLHGEQKLGNIFHQWFQKPWFMKSYRRTVHNLKSAQHISPSIRKDLSLNYNVKACMFGGVAEEDMIYGTNEGATAISLVPLPDFHGASVEGGLCAVALGSFGQGKIGFFGDVNAEDATIETALMMGVSN